jgi:lipopolysaccharide biosynthesis glycosyltransferase
MDMDIVFCIDNNFVQHCGVTITSICENNREENLKFHILTDNLSDKNKRIVEKIVADYKKQIKIYYLDLSILKDCPIRKGDYVSLATYFRILMPSILSMTIDKVLYLDSDIVVRKNLTDLWQIDITNHPIGAVYDMLVDDIRTYNRLCYDPVQRYFNAGVLLINLQYWREHNTTNKLLSFIEINSERLKYHDQDTLNSVIGKETIVLPFQYNMQQAFFGNDPMLRKEYLNEINRHLNDPTIVHYTYIMKPWFKESTHPFKNDYYKYLVLTPWKKYKPVFKYNGLIYRLRYYYHKIKNYIKNTFTCIK